jgi:hypothetical protein
MAARSRGLLVLVVGAALLAIALPAGAMLLPPTGQQCDNGAQASGCTVPGQRVITVPRDPVFGLTGGSVEIAPINVGGDSSCVATDSFSCGGPTGTGPIAIGGNASCTGQPNGFGCDRVAAIAIGGGASCTGADCANDGVSPIAIGGNASCQGPCGESHGTAPIAVGGDATCQGGCGDFGGIGPIAIDGNASCTYYGCGSGDVIPGPGTGSTGPVAVGGNASCDNHFYTGCGSFGGTGPIAVGGNATCSGGGNNCGDIGTAPIAVGGNVSCSGRCGDGGSNLVYPDLPRTGTPALSVGGTATCDDPLDPSALVDPATTLGEVGAFQCAAIA